MKVKTRKQVVVNLTDEENKKIREIIDFIDKLAEIFRDENADFGETIEDSSVVTLEELEKTSEFLYSLYNCGGIDIGETLNEKGK